MGQKPAPPVNIPIPTKIGSKMGGAPSPKIPLVLTHSQIFRLGRNQLPHLPETRHLRLDSRSQGCGHHHGGGPLRWLLLLAGGGKGAFGDRGKQRGGLQGSFQFPFPADQQVKFAAFNARFATFQGKTLQCIFQSPGHICQQLRK